MDAATTWSQIARRIVEGLGVQPGELIEVRDGAGRLDVLLEIVLAIEYAGATPLLQLLTGEYLGRLWASAPRDYLANWDRRRVDWLPHVNRILRLEGTEPEIGAPAADGFEAWQKAVLRLEVLEDEQRSPFLLVAIPTEGRARRLGLAFEALEAKLLPALGASVEELQGEIGRVLAAVSGGQLLTIRTGDGHELRLVHGDRTWLSDDGCIDDDDRARGASVSNLPAGSIYTTVLEGETAGSLWLPAAGPAVDVVLHFEGGRVAGIQAASGAAALGAELDRHSGEPGRVSHVGIALNPYLRQPIGWTLVDEHVHGALFLALGENRYMGGQNESSLNVDYAIPGATLAIDGRVVVDQGRVVV